MIERAPEQKIQAVQEIYDGLEGGIYEDRSRFSLQVEDPGRFLENYARIGQLKERILNRVLQPAPEPEAKVLLVSPLAYAYDTENKILVVGDKKIQLRGKSVILMDYMYENRGQVIDSNRADSLLSEKGYATQIGTSINDLEARIGQKLFTRIGPPRTGAKWALGIVEGESVSQPVSREETAPALPIKPVEPIKPIPPTPQNLIAPGMIIEYRVPESDIRTEEESKILSVIIRSVTAHDQLFFVDLQRELHQFHEAELPVYIYSSRELNQKFMAAYKKLEREFKTPRRQQMWTEADRTIWDRIERRISEKHEGDVEKFKRSIRQYIVKAEKDFYKPFQPG